MLETAIVGGLSLLTALAIFITYSRFDAENFYAVSQSGVAAAGRMLVTLNVPIAFIALGLLAIAVSSLRAAVPGVVKDSDLDFKTINLVPAAGVLIAAGLVRLAIWKHDLGPISPWRPLVP